MLISDYASQKLQLQILTTMREAVRGTIFLASVQAPLVLLAMVAAAAVVAIIVRALGVPGAVRSLMAVDEIEGRVSVCRR